MENHNKSVRKLVFNHLDKITKAAIKATKPFHRGMISITVLKLLIDKAKLPNATDIPADFIEAFNNMLDVLYRVSSDNASKTKLIPITIFKEYIAVLKESFIKAVDNIKK